MGYNLRKTPKGHLFGEASSAMQKAVRRCDEEMALHFATQLDLAGYGEYVWKRIKIMVSEDIGIAEPHLPATIRALYENWLDLRKQMPNDKPAHRIALIHAVILLARAKKSRRVDTACMVFYRDHDAPGMEIPDVALDKHTSRGKRMGRGWEHFFTEGSHLENVPEELVEDPYLERAWEIMQHNPPPWPPGHEYATEPAAKPNGRKPAVASDDDLLSFDFPDQDDEPRVKRRRGVSEPGAAERAARSLKVEKLVSVCREMSLDAATAKNLDSTARATLSKKAGCRPPSETTWAQVVQSL